MVEGRCRPRASMESDEQLLDRFSRWELQEPDPPWRNRMTLRGLDRLPVRLEERT